jgi:hypothetical protein
MWTHALRRCRNAIPAATWFAVSLLLIPPFGRASEPAVSAVRVERPQASTARPRIGRIFFSPAERRTRRAAGSGATSSPPAATSVAPRVRLYVNGALSSSTHGRAVWINGAAVDDNSAGSKSAWTDRNGNIWLTNETQGTRLIRAGQSLDRSGAIEDLLPAGSVTRR